MKTPSDDTALVPVSQSHLTRPDLNPVAVYLGRLSPGSRPTMLNALGNIAVMLTGGDHKGVAKADRDRLAFATLWWELRYQHTARLRALVLERTPGSANLYFAALKGVLKESWRLGLMTAEDRMRAADIESLEAVGTQSGRMLSEAEINKLFSAAGPRDATILAFMAAGGLRRSEVAKLDLADVEDGFLVVRLSKGNKTRRVPIAWAKGPLAAWLAIRGPGPGALFLSANRKRLSPQALVYILAQLAEKTGVARFSPHDLRRTFISLAIEKSKDLFSVQNIVGHANSDTTKRYDRRGDDAMVKVAQLITFKWENPDG